MQGTKGRSRRRRETPGRRTMNIGRCPACNLAFMSKDGEGSYCPNCLYTPGPRITLEDAVAKAEAVALAESHALRADRQREAGHATRRRAA